MINIQLPQNNPLELLKTKTGYADFIQNFAARLILEPEAITQAVANMEESLAHPARDRAINWARMSDAVAEAVGIEVSPDVEVIKPFTPLENIDPAVSYDYRPALTVVNGSKQVEAQAAARQLVNDAYEMARPSESQQLFSEAA